MRALIVMAAVLMVGTGAGFGAFSDQDSGTAAAQFLKLGAGARAAGMGEAFAGVANDATAVYWNPAGLSRVKGKAVSAMHAVWFEDIAYDWLSFVQEQGNGEAWGVGIQYLSYGGIKELDDGGIERGAFTPSNLALSLSYAGAVNGVMLGGNVKYLSSKIRRTASALAADLGVMVSLLGARERTRAGRPAARYGAPRGSKDARSIRQSYPPRKGGYRQTQQRHAGPAPEDRLTIGFVMQNLGTAMKFVNEGDALPLSLKLGAACLLHAGWTVALDVTAPIDNEAVVGVGTEYGLPLNESLSAVGRVGYNTRARDTGGLNGISAGLGLAYRSYSVDYAFVPYGELGNTHRISTQVKF